MTKKKVDIEDLRKDYLAVEPLARQFSEQVSGQISELLKKDAIYLSIPVQTRVKTWDSIEEKLDRVSLNLKKITDLNDLIGFRLILQFKRDIANVCHILQNHFKVVERYDTQERLKDDQFGYSSIHFIVELPDAWLSVPSFSDLKGLRAEIQVRTTAQHIWASASHVLQYKNEASVPGEVRRAIYRVSALLETVDLEFERVLEQRDKYRNAVEESTDDEELNVDLLDQVLVALFPDRPKCHEKYSDLLEELLHFEIGTRRQLEALVKSQTQEVLNKEKEQRATRPEFVFVDVGAVRFALRTRFGKVAEEYIDKRLNKDS